jgi:photosystem II stability/assembly factor-like uncharacterized protein
LCFVDGLSGWVAGHTDRSEAVILSTVDAGISWKNQCRGFHSASINRIYFADSLNGWAVGYNLVLHTNNGGKTWTSQGFRNEPFLSGLSVFDKNNVWVAGGPDVLYKTINGGEKWTKVKLPSNPPFAYLHGITFIDLNTGWAYGKDGVIFSTEDRGHTWKKEASPITSFIWDVAITKSTLFFGSEKGCILAKQR